MTGIGYFRSFKSFAQYENDPKRPQSDIDLKRSILLKEQDQLFDSCFILFLSIMILSLTMKKAQATNKLLTC